MESLNFTIIIDGKQCKDIMSFYEEFYKKFTDWRAMIENGYLAKDGKFNGIGFNLDAMAEILYGGFGVYDEFEDRNFERVTVIFKDFNIAEENLNIDDHGLPFIYRVLYIFLLHSDHITFSLE